APLPEAAALRAGGVVGAGGIQSVATGDTGLIDGEGLAVQGDRARAQTRAAVRVHGVIDGPVTAPAAGGVNPGVAGHRAPTATGLRRDAKTAAPGGGRMTRAARVQSVSA